MLDFLGHRSRARRDPGLRSRRSSNRPAARRARPISAALRRRRILAARSSRRCSGYVAPLGDSWVRASAAASSTMVPLKKFRFECGVEAELVGEGEVSEVLGG